MAVLCACYRAYLRDRHTGAEVAGCDFTDINITEGFWTRDLNIPSTASLNFDLPDLGCCECQAILWQHELVIERTETGSGQSDLVWSGPVTRIVEDRTFRTYQLFASDRSALWARQPYATRDITFPTGTDEGTVWATLIQMAEDCVQSGLLIQPTETGCPITEDLIIPAGTDVTPAIAALTSVHWSVVANRLLGPAADLQGNTIRHRLSTDVDWQDSGAVIDTDGNFTATHVTVTNREPGEEGQQFTASYPTATPEPQRGPGCHTLRIVDPKITSNAQALERARELYNQRRNGNRAIVTSAGTLSKDTELCIADLIPDRTMSVETSGTCSDFTQTVKLNRALVGFAQSADNGISCLSEQRVAVDFIPVGGEPSADRISL